MKNLMLRKLVIVLLILFSLVKYSAAADSQTIGVTFTIPAVPGLNAPLIEETKQLNEPALQAEDQNEPAASVTKEEKLEGITVQTVYAR